MDAFPRRYLSIGPTPFKAEADKAVRPARDAYRACLAKANT
ncbi:hypothetical protein QBA35_36030 [Streptomyces bottropensis]|uniref:Uncharacterized protein n=1 Tax=Streptomyces bottropensis TaxID=42235 RepID=A0ABU8AZK1_9ACTN